MVTSYMVVFQKVNSLYSHFVSVKIYTIQILYLQNVHRYTLYRKPTCMNKAYIHEKHCQTVLLLWFNFKVQKLMKK
jgi:hypothetical protein